MEFDSDLTSLLAADDVPVKRASTSFVEMQYADGPHLTRKQWNRLSRRTRRLLESGVGRIVHIHDVRALEFAGE